MKLQEAAKYIKLCQKPWKKTSTTTQGKKDGMLSGYTA